MLFRTGRIQADSRPLNGEHTVSFLRTLLRQFSDRHIHPEVLEMIAQMKVKLASRADRLEMWFRSASEFARERARHICGRRTGRAGRRPHGE